VAILLHARRSLLFLASALIFALVLAASPESLGKAAFAEPSAKTPDPLRTLTSARDAHSLSDDQAKRGYTIHLRGVITYLDRNDETGIAAIFIHDASGSVYVGQASNLAEDLYVGALVDVRGVSAPGRFGPIIVKPQIRIIGHALLPSNPSRVSLADLRTGAYDAQWVEVQGSVHRVIEYTHNVTLRLELADGPLNVTMARKPGATYSNLVDAEVRVRANAAPTTNAGGEMIGVQLQAPDLSAVQVLEPAPGDPFAVPYIPIDALLRRRHFSTPMHRVHLRGTVTLQWPGASLCIRDATRGICVQTTQVTPWFWATLQTWPDSSKLRITRQQLPTQFSEFPGIVARLHLFLRPRTRFCAADSTPS